MKPLLSHDSEWNSGANILKTYQAKAASQDGYAVILISSQLIWIKKV